MNVQPCPLCGYDAPDLPARPCPHCGTDPIEPSLQRRRAGTFTGVGAGLAALPRGVYYLATTPGVKRWLIPPIALTMVAFALLFWWLWSLITPVIEYVRARGETELPFEEGWLRNATEWLIDTGIVLWMAELSGILVFLVVSTVVALWAFSIVYEAIAGPFLDEIHGRLEERWFGRNPRDSIQRPTDLAPRRCVTISLAAGVPAVAAIVVAWFLGGPVGWAIGLAALPVGFGIASLVVREYGVWLRWVIRIEGGTLLVSVKAAAVAGIVLVLFFPLKLIPGVGYVLFGAVAGFTTALSLLDIPLSRRQWSLRARVSFLVHNLPAAIAYGSVAGLLFLIPIVGPILMVPAASAGGLWMVCRLDKDFLRDFDRRASA